MAGDTVLNKERNEQTTADLFADVRVCLSHATPHTLVAMSSFGAPSAGAKDAQSRAQVSRAMI